MRCAFPNRLENAAEVTIKKRSLLDELPASQRQGSGILLHDEMADADHVVLKVRIPVDSAHVEEEAGAVLSGHLGLQMLCVGVAEVPAARAEKFHGRRG